MQFGSSGCEKYLRSSTEDLLRPRNRILPTHCSIGARSRWCISSLSPTPSPATSTQSLCRCPQQRALRYKVQRIRVASSYTDSVPHRAAVALTPEKPLARVRVAVDVDEVLGRFLLALNKFCKEKYNMDHSISDFHVYEFAKIWMCDQDMSNRIVHEFFESEHFVDGIPVIPGAFEALQRIAAMGGDLVVVTSRQHVIQDQTLTWIDKHFPGLFQDVYFGNHWSLQGRSRKKSEICHSIGASVLIDDNPGYALECASAGIHVLLYNWEGRYPWSQLPPGTDDPNITVVEDWREVEEHLQRLAPRLASERELGPL